MLWKYWKNLKKSTPEDEKARREQMKDVEVTWKDMLAMLISSFFVLVVPAALILVGIVLLAMWMFGLL